MSYVQLDLSKQVEDTNIYLFYEIKQNVPREHAQGLLQIPGYVNKAKSFQPPYDLRPSEQSFADMWLHVSHPLCGEFRLHAWKVPVVAGLIL